MSENVPTNQGSLARFQSGDYMTPNQNPVAKHTSLLVRADVGVYGKSTLDNLPEYQRYVPMYNSVVFNPNEVAGQPPTLAEIHGLSEFSLDGSFEAHMSTSLSPVAFICSQFCSRVKFVHAMVFLRAFPRRHSGQVDRPSDWSRFEWPSRRLTARAKC